MAVDDRLQSIEAELALLKKRCADLETSEAQLKKAEEALSDSVWQWQATFDAISDGVCMLDENGLITRCNRAFVSMVGRDARSVVGRKCYEVVHGTAEPPDFCPIAKMKRSGARETAEYAVGSRWFRVVADPIVDDNGTITGAVHILADITEQHTAEAALRESEEKCRVLAEATFEGICFHDKGVILQANRTFAAMFGMTVDEVVGRNALTLAASESRELVGRSIAAEREEPYEAKGLRKDGSTFWGELRGRSVVFKGRKVRVTVIRDIDARKTAEEEADRSRARLAESEEKYRTLVEGLPLGVIIFRDHTISFANPAALAMLGYERPDEIVGKDLSAAVPEEERERLSGYLDARMSESGAPEHYFTHFARKNGGEFPAEVWVRPTRCRGLAAEQVIIADISDRERLKS